MILIYTDINIKRILKNIVSIKIIIQHVCVLLNFLLLLTFWSRKRDIACFYYVNSEIIDCEENLSPGLLLSII
jgi:phage-related holin